MNFSQWRLQRSTPIDIVLPVSRLPLTVRPVELLDLAVAGHVPPALMQDLSDLEKDMMASKEVRDAGKQTMADILQHHEKTAAFSRKLIKNLVMEDDDTPAD